jgi:hypothetical protein
MFIEPEHRTRLKLQSSEISCFRRTLRSFGALMSFRILRL